MRVHLMGSQRPPEPLILKLTNGISFVKTQYVADGYNRYDVLCIGAAGGQGGGQGWTSPGYSNVFTSGGAGGGGGSQLVEGLDLTALSTSTAVVVGAAGSPGTFVDSPTASTSATNGADGGYSSFGGTICRASGGKGGQKGSVTTPFGGYGGTAGLGGRTTAGGGVAAATSGYLDAPNGTWDPTTKIGSGGPGGIGAVGIWPTPTLYVPPKLGGRGAWNSTDQRFSTPVFPLRTAGAITDRMGPGCGGGASAKAFTNQDFYYGTSLGVYVTPPADTTSQGAVFLRLYQE